MAKIKQKFILGFIRGIRNEKTKNSVCEEYRKASNVLEQPLLVAITYRIDSKMI